MNLPFGIQITRQPRTQSKASAVGSIVSLFKLGQPVWTPRDYASFAKEGYSENVAVFGSIREITSGARSLDWQLFRKQRDGSRVEITDHEILNLLEKPNPEQGGATFIEAAFGYYLIAGNSYIEAIANSRGIVMELHTHRPDRMRVIPGRFGVPAAYQFEANGQTYTWEVDPVTGQADILQWKSFNPLNDWYGMSAIEAAAKSIDTHNEASQWNKALLDNGARPSGALVYEATKGRLGPDQKADLKAEIRDIYQGAGNAGRPLLLEGGLDWKEMGLSPKDMEYLEGKNMSAREIALAYGIPPQILGIPGDNTYSNQKEARLSMWENTILPHADMYRDELNNWLVPRWGDDLFLDYNVDNVTALAARRQVTWDRVKEADFMTDNEKRKAVGMEEIEGGDVLYKPINLIPAGTTFLNDSTSNDKGAKFFNVTSAEDRAREWQASQRLQSGFEKRLTLEFAKATDKRAKAAAEAFKSDGVQGIDIAMNGYQKEVENIFKSNYNGIMDISGNRIFDSFKHKIIEKKDTESYFEASKAAWIQRFVEGRANIVSKTTIDTIFKAVESGEQEGETNVEIADRIVEKTGGQAAVNRARVIAQTEIHAAALAAKDMAIDSLGLDDVTRVWLSSGDAATRDTHLAADGQRRGMKEYFDVGGSKLLRPGDPGGDPSEVINCRCDLLYTD